MSNNTMETAKELSFGTELEYTGISRERAAKAIHSVVGEASGTPAADTTLGR